MSSFVDEYSLLPVSIMLQSYKFACPLNEPVAKHLRFCSNYMTLVDFMDNEHKSCGWDLRYASCDHGETPTQFSNDLRFSPR
jgi:hypothetical protein